MAPSSCVSISPAPQPGSSSPQVSNYCHVYCHIRAHQSFAGCYSTVLSLDSNKDTPARHVSPIFRLLSLGRAFSPFSLSHANPHFLLEGNKQTNRLKVLSLVREASSVFLPSSTPPPPRGHGGKESLDGKGQRGLVLAPFRSPVSLSSCLLIQRVTTHPQ